MSLLDCLAPVNPLSASFHHNEHGEWCWFVLPKEPDRAMLVQGGWLSRPGHSYRPLNHVRLGDYCPWDDPLDKAKGFFFGTFRQPEFHLTLPDLDIAYDIAKERLSAIFQVRTHETDPEVIGVNQIVFFAPPDEVGAYTEFHNALAMYIYEEGSLLAVTIEPEGNP
jgi:hypothetical protein